MRLRWILAALLLPLAGGCGPGEMDETTVQQSQQAYDAGLDAMRRHQTERAAEQLTIAIDGGGLNADQFGEALIHRAICLARMEQFAQAHADLDEAEMGMPEDRVLATRSFVFRLEKRNSEARAALLKAREINPNVKPVGR